MTRVGLLLLLLAVFDATEAQGKSAATSCTICHADPAQVGADRAAIADVFKSDVHAEVGLSCHDCHGGNPALDVATDQRAAKDTQRGAGAYVGAPERADIPGFCGRCHSDPDYMKRFRPDARVDQEREYWTSRHGERLRQGDEKVATCVDCHGVHGIARPSEPRSSVYPTHVAETCRGCHADPTRMAGYALADGSAMPVDQYERWARSVHATALLDKEDLSAPTCNDCHGNHGATPPGLQSVGFVCGQCHGREAELFRNSLKHDGFQDHNEFLEGMDTADRKPCAACHESDPAGQVTGLHRFSECATCHGNHAVLRPTVAMLGPLPETPCQFCHEARGVVDQPAQQRAYEQTRDSLLGAAQQAGRQGDDRFDWLVLQAQQLPQHTETAAGSPGGTRVMKSEFQSLFDKFRIGATHFTYRNPVTGKEVSEPIIRCTNCHAATTSKEGESTLAASAVFLDQMRTLTTNIARTERMLLRAHRGGVAIGNAVAGRDHAIDAQIQLEVLVHGFTTGEGSAFSTAAREGMQQAQEANQFAVAALEELDFRRKGLAAFLGIVLLVLIGLGLKIRELSRRRDEGDSGT